MSEELNDIIEKLKKNVESAAVVTEQNIFSKFLNFKLSISLKSLIQLALFCILALYAWKFYNAIDCKLNMDFKLPKLPSITLIEKTPVVEEVKVTEESKTTEEKKQVKLISVNDTEVVLDSGNGKEVRTEGSASWRYNNPGLIYFGDFAKSVGAIGTDGKYAIFASYDDGRKAQENLLFISKQGYKEKSLEDALKLYAPKNEGFNTDYYATTIKNETSIIPTKVLSTFTPEERKSLLDTLEKIERFKQGKVEIK